ncbi:hypothetical protein THRCLA_20814 [Thraustotheca clavata]|uniref:Uncharacterized protein n=1 Tax=Thraustotheca clavata TaxID=74557 RepID=A0A1W0A3F3_9STRA|nr:hypothetical protein THRCLA_20814 [Thraustotheca clavata]
MENIALPSALSSIHECITYTNGLAKFYETSFEEGKTVHAAQTTEAIKSLKEALELVATNITNVTTTLSSYIDCQMDEIESVNIKMNQLKHRIAKKNQSQELSMVEPMRAPTKTTNPKSNLSTYKITNGSPTNKILNKSYEQRISMNPFEKG